MNRRSVLRWLGLAPVAAPAAVAAAAAPTTGAQRFHGVTARIGANEALDAERRIRVEHDAAALKDMTANGGLTHAFTFDGETLRMQNQRIHTAEQRISAAEGRIGILITAAG